MKRLAPIAKKPADDPDFYELPGGVATWIGALQVTAALAVVGFVAKLAHEQFLGVSLSNWTALDLSIFAGRWAIDTLTIILDSCYQHPFKFLLPVLGLLIPLALSFALPTNHCLEKTVARGSMVVSLVSLSVVLIWCEVPTLAINGWASKSLSSQIIPSQGGFMRHRQDTLRVRLFVSRMGGVATGGGRLTCPVDSTTFNSEKFGELPSYLRASNPTAGATDYLQLLYGLSTVICLLGWLTLSLHAMVDEPTPLDEIYRVIRLFIVLFFLPVVSCLLPYMYGKLIYSTELPVATLTLKAVSAAKDTSQPTEPQQLKDVLIVDETDKEISVMSVAPGDVKPYVRILHRDDISTTTIDESRDIVTQLIRTCNWVPVPGD